jgi:hypothetical protein
MAFYHAIWYLLMAVKGISERKKDGRFSPVFGCAES